MPSLKDATQPRDMSKYIPIDPAQIRSGSPSNISLGGNNLSLALAPVPSVLGETPDTQRQYYRGGVSQYRMLPLPAASIIAAGAAAQSQIIFASQNTPTPAVSKFYDIIFSLAGRPNGSFTYPWMVFDRPVGFQANFAGSRGAVLINPASSFTITLNKNGGSIGTITVSTGGVVTFSSGTAQGVVAGDILSLLTPSADPTLSGLMLILSGTPS